MVASTSQPTQIREEPYFEITWLRRGAWSKCEGVIIGSERSGNGTDIAYYPIISYEATDGTKEFTSGFGLNSRPNIGERVQIVYDPDTFEAEHYSKQNRVEGSVGVLIFAIITLVVGLLFMR